MSCSKRPCLGRIRCGDDLRINAADVIRQEYGMIEEDLRVPARRSYGSARCRREDDARSWWCGSVRGPRPAGVKTRLPQCRICEFAMGGGGSIESRSDDELVQEGDPRIRSAPSPCAAPAGGRAAPRTIEGAPGREYRHDARQRKKTTGSSLTAQQH